MARPKLEIGTYGEIAVKEESPGSWRATARYRDLDGTTRLVKAYGQSESKAKAALKSKLKKRRRPGGVDAELTPDSTVAELLKHWLSVCESVCGRCAGRWPPGQKRGHLPLPPLR
ncbi:hypothetical protein [Tsukamurella soli]|uniref:hypothetical protein n=1 Tax=Tsukamurella soli TaxID=644556 RepID=UPI0036240E20